MELATPCMAATAPAQRGSSAEGFQGGEASGSCHSGAGTSMAGWRGRAWTLETGEGLDAGKRRFGRFESACAGEKWRGLGESQPSRPFCPLPSSPAACCTPAARRSPALILCSLLGPAPLHFLHTRSLRSSAAVVASVVALPNIALIAWKSCGRRAPDTIAASDVAPRLPAIRPLYTACGPRSPPNAHLRPANQPGWVSSRSSKLVRLCRRFGARDQTPDETPWLTRTRTRALPARAALHPPREAHHLHQRCPVRRRRIHHRLVAYLVHKLHCHRQPTPLQDALCPHTRVWPLCEWPCIGNPSPGPVE